jgi:class 3 adenylate cyclase/tetratricopeptide (TPR) repeat protein
MRFCTQCGSALDQQTTPATSSGAATERRVISALFADLVGFTPASEGRDPEETRELLSRYFELARTVVERYGGMVEKFIGDAVMAVWGTPAAQEDDAERAVRAALDLVAAVPELDGRLQARAGVLTGEAAVNVDAEGEGMVAGDLVNTASRVQGAAEPGVVLVGEVTRRSSEAAIAYEDAGSYDLKGKAEPIQLSRALRVIAARGGALRASGLEPPFVGRGRELRLVKELFHAGAEDDTAHLVSVVGAAGNGKSRLAWEFYKYIDGLAEVVLWHRGRCLPYGEGVTYWALAEMVRMRAGIAEGEEPETAREQLREATELYVRDADERSWIEPRLAHLLGLEERQVHEREDLFAGWRRFFERMAEEQPVVLVFDDMQWADPSLLDFVEYLMEWSRHYAIFVLALARPELVERNSDWGAGKRNFTSLALEPLPPDAMDALLVGLVPGLPDELTRRILGRAEGVPLYAVETVRMLLDRGLVRREADSYRPTGDIEALDVPETLHALVAARLDGLDPEERRLIQDASVVGRTFTEEALAAVSGVSDESLKRTLAALVRKELLSVQSDPRSPERGQFGFVQDLLKQVAYETLARRERKRRHLSAASYLERAFDSGDPELVEVVSAHYLDAYEAAPDDEDAPGIKAKALAALTRAGERAASLAASEEAARYFSQAAELADEPLKEAELRERAGDTATAAARYEQGQAHYRRAIELLEAHGQTHPAARVLASLGWTDWRQGQLAQAIERMESAFTILAADEPDADFAALAAELGRLNFFADKVERASELLELAVSLGEDLVLPEVLAQALITHGLISGWRGRLETAFALTSHALKLALENDLPTPALRAYNNLADTLTCRDRYAEGLAYHESGLALARRVGNRQWEWQLLAEMTYPLAFIGRWDDALASMADVPNPVVGALALPPLMPVDVQVARGCLAEAREFISLLPSPEGVSDVQLRTMLLAMHATLLRAEGRNAEASAVAEQALEGRHTVGWTHQAVKNAFVEAAESAFALGTDDATNLLRLLETLRPGQITPYVRAQSLRFRARLAALDEVGGDVEPGFKQAEGMFREFGIPFWLAVTQLEHAEWLATQGRADDASPLAEEARQTFERLEAAPWLERAARVPVTAPVQAA